ncbi:hypothetical protein EYF80_013567 [Liparis tanakae]|uniref:Uncharacterized protein n=1 Tax=Liparis tanakae TaxID=230148 RepID=A0A4Z2IDW8_9TELE|nr:hypothetical protein EYF80_013567 [Liparis tanakae]
MKRSLGPDDLYSPSHMLHRQRVNTGNVHRSTFLYPSTSPSTVHLQPVQLQGSHVRYELLHCGDCTCAI